MIKIIADDKIPFLKGVFDAVADVVYLPGKEIKRQHLLNADALIIRTRTRCDEALLNNTAIRMIATATIGFDHIDVDYCQRNGIVWTNAPGCNSSSVKQYLASALGIIIEKQNKRFREITLGVVGAGHVGAKVVSMAEALGIRTLVNDPPRARLEGEGYFVSLDYLLEQSDILTLHVPLQYSGADKTFHFAGSEFFEKAKSGAWLINTSRGEVVNTGSLMYALKNHTLAGSIIDVWENEPCPEEELLSLADISTPHIAGYSTDGKANGTKKCVQAVSRFFGLGLDDWSPAAVPLPEHPKLRVNCKGKSPEELFVQMTRMSYNITYDSESLKDSPSSFERLRGNYPVRREPHAYELHLAGGNNKALRIAQAVGFENLILES